MSGAPWTRMLALRFVAVLGEMLSPSGADAECLPRAQDGVYVYDFAGVLRPDEEAALQQSLEAARARYGIEMAIVVTYDLCGMPISMFANKLGNEWGVGDGERDDGFVIAMRPKRAGAKGQVFIATGSGVQGRFPDIVVSRIIEEQMIPSFKEGRLQEGLQRGVEAIVARFRAPEEKESSSSWLVGAVNWFVRAGKQMASALRDQVFLVVWIFLPNMLTYLVPLLLILVLPDRWTDWLVEAAPSEEDGESGSGGERAWWGFLISDWAWRCYGWGLAFLAYWVWEPAVGPLLLLWWTVVFVFRGVGGGSSGGGGGGGGGGFSGGSFNGGGSGGSW